MFHEGGGVGGCVWIAKPSDAKCFVRKFPHDKPARHLQRHGYNAARMLSLIIPLYNEEENVAPLQDELAAALKGHEYELILVDDCSTDKTLERIRRGPGVRVIEFEKNTGQSAAMYAGIMAARGDILVTMDRSEERRVGKEC